MCWMKFQAFTCVKNFEDALIVNAALPASKLDADALDPTDMTNAAAITAYNQDKMAGVQFTMAMTIEVVLVKVNEAKSTDWPQGLVSLLVDAPKRKYQPGD